MAATDSSTGTSLTGAWLTAAQSDAVIGYPNSPEWPGPTSEDHSSAGVANPGRSGPPQGTAPPIPVTGGDYLPDLSGGEILDTVADLGHSGPLADFDSSAGQPFAPSGPIADTHGDDTGGTLRKEHVPMPVSPGWWRRVLSGQTFNRQAQVTDNAGWHQLAVNGRTNLDQSQGQNADGYDPMVIPYSERPLRANFAAEAYPIDPIGGAYAVDGQLPDMTGMGGQGNFAYTSPPDPSVTLTSQQPGEPGPWSASAPDLGMEYVSG